MEPGLVRGVDGHLYERIYTQPPQALIPERRHEIHQAYVSSQPPSPRHAPLHQGYDSRAQAISSHVLPSIEDTQPLSPNDGRSRAPQHDYRTDRSLHHLDDYAQTSARPRNVQVIDLTEGSNTQISKRRRVEEPVSARRHVDHRRISSQTRPRDDYGRPAREPPQYGPEIIDLSGPRFVRDALADSPRMVADRQPIELRMDGGHGIRSDARAFRPLAEASHNAPANRYAYGPDPVHDRTRSDGFPLSPRVRHPGQINFGTERQYVQQPEAGYRPEDPAIRSEHLVTRNPARVPVYDGGGVSYSREYLPVIRNHALMPDVMAQQHQPNLVNQPRGPQHDRYDIRRNRYQLPDAGRPLPWYSSQLTHLQV